MTSHKRLVFNVSSLPISYIFVDFSSSMCLVCLFLTILLIFLPYCRGHKDRPECGSVYHCPLEIIASQSLRLFSVTLVTGECPGIVDNYCSTSVNGVDFSIFLPSS